MIGPSALSIEDKFLIRSKDGDCTKALSFVQSGLVDLSRKSIKEETLFQLFAKSAVANNPEQLASKNRIVKLFTTILPPETLFNKDLNGETILDIAIEKMDTELLSNLILRLEINTPANLSLDHLPTKLMNSISILKTSSRKDKDQAIILLERIDTFIKTYRHRVRLSSKPLPLRSDTIPSPYDPLCIMIKNHKDASQANIHAILTSLTAMKHQNEIFKKYADGNTILDYCFENLNIKAAEFFLDLLEKAPLTTLRLDIVMKSYKNAISIDTSCCTKEQASWINTVVIRLDNLIARFMKTHFIE